MNPFLYPIELIKLDIIDSTQDYLMKKSQFNNYSNKWIVTWALEQTKGRGTYGNQWKSEKNKNLTFSFLIQTYISIKKSFLLNICIANAIHKRLSLEGEGFFIKWPNDLVLNNKKIAGILIENQIIKKKIQRSIIGIGLNVNQEKFEMLNKASSLKNILNKNFCLKDLLISLLIYIQIEYYLLLKGEDNILKNYYLSYLFKKNQISYFKINNLIYKGIIEGFYKEGQLIVSFLNGKKKYFFPKEIEMIY